MSNSKRELVKVYIVIHLVLVPLFSLGQNDSTGIYASADDFLSNRLTYSASCSNEGNKISFREKVIKLKIGDGAQKGAYKLKNDRVFGLKTCKNTYRFQDGLEYKVVNTEDIPLYSRTIMAGGDGSFYDEIYFFSIKPEGEIKRLTKRGLKEAYSSNSEFVNYIETVFKNDYDLNNRLNPYMLVYFFKKCKE
jgi:hypothetical protein